MKKSLTIFLLSIVSICLLFYCTQPVNREEQKDTIKKDFSKAKADSTAIADSSPILPEVLLIDKNKNIVDTLDKINLHDVVSLLNKPATFPAGFASLQGLGSEGIVYCSTYTFKLPELASPKPSLFQSGNVKGIFVFLTQVDSNKLVCSDYDYSLLRFLRYKTVLEALPFSVKDGKEENVNVVDYRKIIWGKPLNIKLFDETGIFKSSFSEWKEIWSCAEKHDYSIPYPTINLFSTSLIKTFPKKYSNDWGYKWYNNPLFVFSVIKLQDNKPHVIDTIKECSVYDTLLVTPKIKAKCIDLNKDKIPDAMWYTDYYNNRNYSLTYLYLNIDGSWELIWYKHFDVNKSYLYY
ncbi:MAG TPA: hypothetical protein VNB90_01695 [Cytophagaceae bacterium]|jgi:hypothetical protein|nr:hypothetical protein [Cytophagaceae bacterium]